MFFTDYRWRVGEIGISLGFAISRTPQDNHLASRIALQIVLFTNLIGEHDVHH